MGEGAKRTRIILRTIKNSLLAPGREETGSYRAGEFQVARPRLCRDNAFRSRREDDSRPALTLAGASWLEADVIMGGVAQLLLANQIPLSRLDGDVPGQELNMLEFAASWLRRRNVRRRSSAHGEQVSVPKIPRQPHSMCGT